jgi:tetratricopeptide (TPR) repeat protein
VRALLLLLLLAGCSTTDPLAPSEPLPPSAALMGLDAQSQTARQVFHMRYAEALGRVGGYDKAEEQYLLALRENPNNETAHFNLSMIYVMRAQNHMVDVANWNPAFHPRIHEYMALFEQMEKLK